MKCFHFTMFGFFLYFNLLAPFSVLNFVTSNLSKCLCDTNIQHDSGQKYLEASTFHVKLQLLFTALPLSMQY